MKKFWIFLGALSLGASVSAESPAPRVQWGAFFDTFYSFDANQPPNRERLFTTNPSRHNEFNINLAYIEGKINTELVRGRLALQTGTSVFANYSNELRDSTRPGGAQLADILMHIQEAYAGYRLAPGLWIDAGIYFSHIGAETFISKDNWIYTRSLIADFSPYYQAGVKLSWEPNSRWAFQLHLINGWQNILETNDDKALGTQIVFKPNERFTITHNSFLGKETNLRFFQDLILKYQWNESWESSLSVDVGLQKQAAGFLGHWWGTSLLNRFRINPRLWLGARAEYYEDAQSFIVSTGTPGGFQVGGASVNGDIQLTSEVLWRTELRFLQSKDALFSGQGGNKFSTLYATTSFSLSL